jgi:hypothetical protein
MTEFRDDATLEEAANAVAEEIALATGGLAALELEMTAPPTLVDPSRLSGPVVSRTVLEPLSAAERDAMRTELEEALPDLPSPGKGKVQGPNGQMVSIGRKRHGRYTSY